MLMDRFCVIRCRSDENKHLASGKWEKVAFFCLKGMHFPSPSCLLQTIGRLLELHELRAGVSLFWAFISPRMCIQMSFSFPKQMHNLSWKGKLHLNGVESIPLQTLLHHYTADTIPQMLVTFDRYPWLQASVAAGTKPCATHSPLWNCSADTSACRSASRRWAAAHLQPWPHRRAQGGTHRVWFGWIVRWRFLFSSTAHSPPPLRSDLAGGPDGASPELARRPGLLPRYASILPPSSHCRVLQWLVDSSTATLLLSLRLNHMTFF